MKIKIAVDQLSDVLKNASGVVQGKVTIEVLKYIKIVISGAKATAYASDLGMSIIQTFPILGLTDAPAGVASFLLPVHKMQEILAALASQKELNFDVTEKSVKVHVNKTWVKLPMLPVDQFPEVEAAAATKFTIKLGTLKRLIRRVEVAVPSKESKFVSPIIHVEGTDALLRAVATDGFRIVVADAPGVGALDVNIPKSALPLLKDLQGEDVAFSETETKYFFVTEKATLLIQKSVAKFPPYQRAMSIVFTTESKVPSPDLKGSIDVVKTVVDSSDPRVVIQTAENGLVFSASSVDGEAEDYLGVILTGSPARVTLNPNFILDYLAQTEGQATVLQFSGERGPVLLSTDATYRCFIMPIQPKTDAKKA